MPLADQLYYIRDLLRSKTARAFSIVVVANFAVTLLGFVSSILIFRSQGPELIATIFPLVALYLFLDQISDLGLSVAYIRFASADFEKGEETFHRTTNASFQAHTLLATVFVLAAVLGAKRISILLFQSEENATWVVCTALLAWLYSLTNFLQCILQAQKNFSRIAWARVIPNVVKTALLLLLVLRKNTDLGPFLVAFLVSPLLSGLVMLPALDWRSFVPRKHSMAEFSRLFDFSKWVFFSSVAVACIAHLDLFMLRSMAPEEEVARFLGGQRLASVLPLLIGSMVTILLPKVSSMRSREEVRFFTRKALMVSPLLFLLILSFSFAAPWVIPLALGAKYQTSVGIFQAYCWVYAIDAVVTLSSLFVYNLSLVHWFAILNVMQLTLNYALNLKLIPAYGGMGVCLSAGLIRVAAIPLMLYLGSRERMLSEAQSS